jgi:hypothetical protein
MEWMATGRAWIAGQRRVACWLPLVAFVPWFKLVAPRMFQMIWVTDAL